MCLKEHNTLSYHVKRCRYFSSFKATYRKHKERKSGFHSKQYPFYFPTSISVNKMEIEKTVAGQTLFGCSNNMRGERNEKVVLLCQPLNAARLVPVSCQTESTATVPLTI